MKTSSVKLVRCAIYTRVSTEHGLDQEFNSLDAQYEALICCRSTQISASSVARARIRSTSVQKISLQRSVITQ